MPTSTTFCKASAYAFSLGDSNLIVETDAVLEIPAAAFGRLEMSGGDLELGTGMSGDITFTGESDATGRILVNRSGYTVTFDGDVLTDAGTHIKSWGANLLFQVQGADFINYGIIEANAGKITFDAVTDNHGPIETFGGTIAFEGDLYFSDENGVLRELMAVMCLS